MEDTDTYMKHHVCHVKMHLIINCNINKLKDVYQGKFNGILLILHELVNKRL